MQAKQDSILKVLRLRFDAVPESLSGKINSIRDFPRLDELLEKAVTAETLDEIDFHSHENQNLSQPINPVVRVGFFVKSLYKSDALT